MTEVKKTDQFRKVTTPGGRVALEAYCAVFRQANGEHVAICSPDRKMLTTAYIRLTGLPLNESAVQDVWITKRGEDAEQIQEAPR